MFTESAKFNTHETFREKKVIEKKNDQKNFVKA